MGMCKPLWKNVFVIVLSIRGISLVRWLKFQNNCYGEGLWNDLINYKVSTFTIRFNFGLFLFFLDRQRGSLTSKSYWCQKGSVFLRQENGHVSIFLYVCNFYTKD